MRTTVALVAVLWALPTVPARAQIVNDEDHGVPRAAYVPWAMPAPPRNPAAWLGAPTARCQPPVARDAAPTSPANTLTCPNLAAVPPSRPNTGGNIRTVGYTSAPPTRAGEARTTASGAVKPCKAWVIQELPDPRHAAIPAAPLAASTTTGPPAPPVTPEPTCEEKPCWLCWPPRDLLGGLTFFSEGGVDLVRPLHNHGDPIVTVTRAVPSGFGPAGATTPSFRYDLAGAPRVTLGVINDAGYGLSMSWWTFQENSLSFTGTNNLTGGLTFGSPPLPGIPGLGSPSPTGTALGIVNDSMLFGARTSVTTWDWEGFCSEECRRWQVRETLGLRYGSLSQTYSAARVNSGSTTIGTTAVALNTDSDGITSGHEFNGLGPTNATILRRPIAGTNLAFFFSDRLSLLFGSNHTRSLQIAQASGTITPLGGPTTPFSTVTGSNSFHDSSICMPIETIEAGFEWTHELRDSRVYFRAGVVDHNFFDAGNATNEHGNLTLIGMALVGGVLY